MIKFTLTFGTDPYAQALTSAHFQLTDFFWYHKAFGVPPGGGVCFCAWVVIETTAKDRMMKIYLTVLIVLQL